MRRCLGLEPSTRTILAKLGEDLEVIVDDDGARWMELVWRAARGARLDDEDATDPAAVAAALPLPLAGWAFSEGMQMLADDDVMRVANPSTIRDWSGE